MRREAGSSWALASPLLSARSLVEAPSAKKNSKFATTQPDKHARTNSDPKPAILEGMVYLDVSGFVDRLAKSCPSTGGFDPQPVNHAKS